MVTQAYVSGALQIYSYKLSDLCGFLRGYYLKKNILSAFFVRNDKMYENCDILDYIFWKDLLAKFDTLSYTNTIFQHKAAAFIQKDAFVRICNI